MNVSKVRPLGDVADFLSGFAWKAKQFSDDPDGMPIIRIQNVGADASTEFKYWPDTYADRFVISKGDLLLTLSGSFRTAVWSGPNALLNQRIVKVTPRNDTDTRWLFYALEEAMARIANMGRHALVSNVALSDLKELGINVPPLDEQKRIAGILDQADALRRLRTRALDKLNTLGHAIFHEMFGETTEPATVQTLLNDKILLVHKDGNHGSNYPRKEEFGQLGVPFLSAKAIDDNGHLIGSAVEYLDETKAKSLKIGWIKEGDVLLSHNASVGKVANYHGEFGPALIGTSLTCYRPNPDKLRSDFLEFALKSFDFQAQLFSNMSQTTRNQVPITAQKRLSLAIPSIGEQIRFESKIATISAATNSQRAALYNQETLFVSLQHRAFRGEL